MRSATTTKRLCALRLLTLLCVAVQFQGIAGKGGGGAVAEVGEAHGGGAGAGAGEVAEAGGGGEAAGTGEEKGGSPYVYGFFGTRAAQAPGAAPNAAVGSHSIWLACLLYAAIGCVCLLGGLLIRRLICATIRCLKKK
jgi:hypothetical protein